MEIPQDKLPAIREAIHGGPEHKIAAIKLVREATGCDLAEAKAFVESFPASPVDGTPSERALKNVAEDQRRLILEAIHAGPERKIDAIKLLREATGLGLAEAKDLVEKLARELHAKEPGKSQASPAPATTKSGCLGVLMALAVGLGASVFTWVMILGR